MAGLTISISELRNRFDKYMRRVKSGETIIVTKRGKPIAQFTPAKMMQRSENRIYSKGKRRDIEIWPKWAQAAVLGGVAPRLVLSLSTLAPDAHLPRVWSATMPGSAGE